MDLFNKLTITGVNEGGIFFAALSVPKSGMVVISR